MNKLKERLRLPQNEPPFEVWQKPAAVMINVAPGGEEPVILLTLRPAFMDEHAGQVAFPGGRFDPDADETLWQTAVRETQEEVGVVVRDHERVGYLEPIYVAASGYTVLPCVAQLDAVPSLAPAPDEVADAAWFALSEFERARTEVWHRGRRVPEFLLPWARVWGATARMLDRFLANPHWG